MSVPIRILYVDDNLLDRELVRDSLETNNGEFQIVEAASRAEFKERLAEGGYDIVLSDFNILGFEGLQVIDAVHAKAQSLPVIIVTGTGSEEVAIESMRNGAADYVVKTPKHIRRLPLTIRATFEKRRLEDEKIQAQKERDRLFNFSIDLLCIAGFDGHFKQLNPAWQKTLGWTNDELFSRPYLEFVHPEDREHTVVSVEAANDAKPVSPFENRFLCKDGAYKWISWTSYQLADEGLIFAVGRDITEHKRDEEELRLLYLLVQDISLSEDFCTALEVSLKMICEATGWVMGEAWVPAPDGSHLECSPAWYGKSGFDGLKKFRKMSEGFKFQPGIGIPGRVWSSQKSVWDLDVTQDSNFPRRSYAIEAGLKAGMAIPILSQDQVVAVLEFFVMEMREEDKRMVDLVSTIAAYLGGLFQYKQAQEELRKLYIAIEQSPVSVFITDTAFKIQYINPKFIEVTGYSREEAIGMKPDIFSSGALEISDTEWRGEFLASKKNGEPFWEYATISPIKNAKGEITNFIGIHEDITERRKLEDQLRHSQKLEALGQLVGGIAHDFNNILTAIIGFAGMMQMKMKKDDPQIENVEQVLGAAERGAILTRGLLMFGRKQAIFPMQVNLNEIIKQAKTLLSRFIGEGIELRTVTVDGELNVMADSMQIEQVLMNLATNARDAMQGEGELVIETRREEIDKAFIKDHGYGEPGQYALVSVSDTGAGMDESTREKIFEPFFTTKEVGKGTGLGLSIVYGIVKQHNGYITVYSEVGKGTTFKIYLPILRNGAVKAEPLGNHELAASEPSHLTGTATVLVAEDDKIVRHLSKTLLESFGYTVIEAENGVEAVQKYIENKDSINLLLLDVIMPRKNGREAYEEIKKITPDVRVIFMSGYTADVMKAKGIIETGMVFISKPVSPTEFIKKVKEVLDR